MIDRHSQQYSESSKTSSTSGQVLVVDDNVELLSVLEDVLKMSGFDVVSADSAEAALEKIEASIPDIIVCDVMMPGMNGYEFFQEVSSHEEHCRVPFLFLTALSGEEEVREAKRRGCDDYLIKPFNPEDLVAIVSGKLDSAQSRNKSLQNTLEDYRRRIINTLSHEFRTPLVAINTGAELLLEQDDDYDKDRMRYLVESIHRGGMRLQRLVDDFMVIQQIESGLAEEHATRFKRVHVSYDIARNAVESFIETEADPDVVVELEHVEEDMAAFMQIECYDIQVRDVLIRVLSNAAKFGGKEGPIKVSVDARDDWIQLKIRDQGPGLDNGFLREACATFNQIGREKLEQQGCGLGLTIARLFVGLNGGKLDFDTPEDGGLEVCVSFPRAAG